MIQQEPFSFFPVFVECEISDLQGKNIHKTMNIGMCNFSKHKLKNLSPCNAHHFMFEANYFEVGSQ